MPEEAAFGCLRAGVTVDGLSLHALIVQTYRPAWVLRR
jgi:hypothetical protein